MSLGPTPFLSPMTANLLIPPERQVESLLCWWHCVCSREAVGTVRLYGLLRVTLAHNDTCVSVMPRASVTVRTLAQSAGVDLIEKLLALPYCEQAAWFFPLTPQPLRMETQTVRITETRLNTGDIYTILFSGTRYDTTWDISVYWRPVLTVGDTGAFDESSWTKVALVGCLWGFAYAKTKSEAPSFCKVVHITCM